MKKILFAFVLLFAVSANAQLNYLLSAYSKTYQPIVNGNVAVLSGPTYSNTPLTEWGTASVPIGFNFNYNGVNYSNITVNVNGFLSFRNIPVEDYGLNNSQNDLAAGTWGLMDPFGVNSSRPIVAPFWDDLGLHSVNDLVYKTTGFAPFRVFTLEWKNAYWNIDHPFYPQHIPVGAKMEDLSFQVRFYEFTNMIEFHYKDEGRELAPPDANNVFLPYQFGASIGLTPAYCQRDFIALQSSSSNPEISSVIAWGGIRVKPANNQVYRFTPSFVKLPIISRNKLTYTNNSISFNMDPGNVNGYSFEYALTNSAIPPVSGTITNRRDVNIAGLLPSTTYYLYARSKWFGFNSQWVVDTVKTAANNMNTPYLENFDGTPPGSGSQGDYLPANLRIQDLNDTVYGYNINIYDPTYFGPFVAGGSLLYLQGYFYDANVWTFTPGINLQKGKKYKLSFKYLCFPLNTPDIPAQLEVKYGTSCGVGGMNSGTLFSKTDILNSDNFITAEVSFNATKNSPYYFGFHNFSTFNGAILFIDDISVTEDDGNRTSQIPIALTGTQHSGSNVLNWKGHDSKKQVVIENSADGISFSPIATVEPVKQKFNFGKKPISNINTDEKNNVIIDNNHKMILPQKSANGINFVPFAEKNMSIKHMPDSYSEAISLKTYYRIKQTDAKGSTVYSNIVKLGADNSIFSVYPNPSANGFRIQSTEGKTYKAIVFDMKGRMVASYSSLNNNMDFGAELPKGVYLLKLQIGNEVKIRKIEKL